MGSGTKGLGHYEMRGRRVSERSHLATTALAGLGLCGPPGRGGELAGVLVSVSGLGWGGSCGVGVGLGTARRRGDVGGSGWLWGVSGRAAAKQGSGSCASRRLLVTDI